MSEANGSLQPLADSTERVRVTVELFGVPRVRAARNACDVEAATVGEAVAELERACPTLSGTVICDGRLLSAYRVALNASLFVSDMRTRLMAGDSLLVVAADAGG